MKGIQLTLSLGFMALLGSCAIFSEGEGEACQPACSSDLTCVDGLCQPIRCVAQEDCGGDLLCFEGRCVTSCDGLSPCLSRQCADGLCVGTMECRQGDVRSCESACGEGVERCVDYMWTTCSIGGPEPIDRCGDGADNDCDGVAEEGCPACEEGEVKGCESECGVGEQQCEEGVWSTCSVPPPDAAGICPCEEGSFEVCETPCGAGQATCLGGVFGECLYEGERCECESGAVEVCELACGAGQRVCDSGAWSACMGPQPRGEVCFNRIDDDCDQQVDEGCEECTARHLNQNDFFTSLPNSHQEIPLVSSGLKVWLSWYGAAVPRKAYVQGASFENRMTIRTDKLQLSVGSVDDLSALSDGGGVAQLAIDAQDRIVMSFAGANSISSTRTINPPGTIWDARVVGDYNSQQVLYRSDALYLQRILSGQSQLPPPLRLTTRINHLGHDVVRGGGRISVFYQDTTAELDEGRVLTMVQASDNGELLLGERPIVDPVTGEPLYVFDRPTAIFKSNQLLVAYSHRAEGMDYIKTALLSLDGDVLSGPHTIVQSTYSESPGGLDLAVNRDRRALVWYEQTGVMNMTKVKYVGLDEQGLPVTDVKLIARGKLRLFPKVTYLNDLPTIIWSQTDDDPEFGGELYSLRLAQYDHDPGCW